MLPRYVKSGTQVVWKLPYCLHAAITGRHLTIGSAHTKLWRAARVYLAPCNVVYIWMISQTQSSLAAWNLMWMIRRFFCPSRLRMLTSLWRETLKTSAMLPSSVAQINCWLILPKPNSLCFEPDSVWRKSGKLVTWVYRSLDKRSFLFRLSSI